jgi:DNA invertase Pin-like site-specific DNA recombinase
LRKSSQGYILDDSFSGGLRAMLIGYIRVSKSDGSQTLAPQRDALLAAGVEPDRIYQDCASGRRDDRPGLVACLKALQPGNTLVVWKLDRLGRDLRHLVNTVEDLRVRGVGLKVLTGAGAQIDTTTANGRLAFGIFAAFAEFERELVAERTHAGLAAARARGRKGGRPRKMNRSTLLMAVAAMADPKAKVAEVARRLGVTTTTFYVYLNRDGTLSRSSRGTATTCTTWPSSSTPSLPRSGAFCVASLTLRALANSPTRCWPQGCQSDPTPTLRHPSHRCEPDPMIAGRSQIIRA